MVHCNKRGSEAFMGHMSHTFKYEQGTASAIANVFVNKVHNFDDGTFSIDEVKEGIRGNDAHEPLSQLVCIENTHNMAGMLEVFCWKKFFTLKLLHQTGGKVLPLDWIEELSKVCKENNLKLHMDGARIFNAAEFLKLPVSRIVRDVDSVCFCLSKNLCCPVGSVLLGTKTFINEARRYRKALGGGMRQAGFLAAPGLYAMENIVPLLGIDHQHARQLAEAIDNLKSSIFQVELENLQTNILMIKVNKNSMNIAAQDFCNRLAEVKESEVANGICDEMKTPIIIKSGVKNASTLRVVFYRQIDDQLTQLAIKKVSHIIGEFEALLSTHTTD